MSPVVLGKDGMKRLIKRSARVTLPPRAKHGLTGSSNPGENTLSKLPNLLSVPPK
jgi:hypothetical protein